MNRKKNIHFRLSERRHAALKAAAEALDKTATQVLEEAIDEKIERETAKGKLPKLNP